MRGRASVSTASACVHAKPSCCDQRLGSLLRRRPLTSQGRLSAQPVTCALQISLPDCHTPYAHQRHGPSRRASSRGMACRAAPLPLDILLAPAATAALSSAAFTWATAALLPVYVLLVALPRASLVRSALHACGRRPPLKADACREAADGHEVVLVLPSDLRRVLTATLRPACAQRCTCI